MGEDTSKIRAAIDDARTQLGNTLEALSFKTDVPARASEAISQTVDAVKATVEETSGVVKANLDEASGHARELLKDASSTLNKKISETSELLNNSVKDASQTVKEVSHKAGEYADAGREKLDQAKDYAEFNLSLQIDRVVSFTRESPLVALGLAIGGGFVLGRLLAPKSR